MRIGSLGLPELLIILLVVLLIFGPRRLPDMAKGLGQSVREFRKGVKDMKEDFEAEASEPAPKAAASQAATAKAAANDGAAAPAEPQVAASTAASDAAASEPTASEPTAAAAADGDAKPKEA